jgi:UDP-galactopyranose mutase
MIIIVGAGLSGATLANLYARKLNKQVIIFEKREHIGGNCYDYIDDLGILCSKYGPHFFHTNSEKVWEFVNQFANWIDWEHRVLANIDNKFVSVPVNIDTVNKIFGLNISNTDDMNNWLNNNTGKIENPENSEESCINRVGKILYEKIFRDYTIKQWNITAKELDSSVLNRIPIRNNNDDRYFTDKYQAVPEKGYTRFIEKMLDHPNIKVLLNTDFFELRKDYSNYQKIFYTGPIDSYFKNAGLPSLEYRTVYFEEEIINQDYYQPVSQVNYPSLEYQFTRITEYKRVLNKREPIGITKIVKEYSTGIGEPYYPIPNIRNIDLYNKYRELAEIEEKNNKVYFVGRLATYKYFNMDQAILSAIETFEKIEEIIDI